MSVLLLPDLGDFCITPFDLAFSRWEWPTHPKIGRDLASMSMLILTSLDL